MPPVPVTFHNHILSHRGELYRTLPPPIDNKTPAHRYYSVSRRPAVTRKSPSTAEATRDAADIPAAAAVLASGSGSTSSSSSAVGTASARRKGTARRAPSATPSSSSAYITLTPLNSSIIDRCLLQAAGATVPIPTKAVNAAAGPSTRHGQARAQPSPAPIHPYSRLTDLANDRSPNPSPRELLRTQRANEEQARVKKDLAAAARAAIAAKRKKGKGGGKNGAAAKGKENAAGVAAARSPSPAEGPSGKHKGKDKDASAIPTITTEPAPSSNASEAPFRPTSRSLKRSWSSGLAPVATGIANAHGAGNLGIGSPLKAVTGPHDTDEAAEAHRAKRSKTDEPSGPSSGPVTRKKSLSPPNNAQGDSPPVPKTVPLAPGRLGPGLASTRQGTRSTSVSAEGAGAAGASMRRAVSSAGSAAAPRRGSAGSQGSEGGTNASQRSKREVNLPKALRDYEMRAGTVA